MRRCIYFCFIVLFSTLEITAQPAIFSTNRINRLTFIETKLNGEKVQYKGVEAYVFVSASTNEKDMKDYAENIFSNKLRELADYEQGNLIFITFHLEKVFINGQDGWKTFRIIYQKKDAGWIRLNK